MLRGGIIQDGDKKTDADSPQERHKHLALNPINAALIDWISTPISRALNSLTARVYPAEVVRDLLDALGTLSLKELKQTSVVNDLVRRVTLTDALEQVPMTETSQFTIKRDNDVSIKISSMEALGIDPYDIAIILLKQDPAAPNWREFCELSSPSESRSRGEVEVPLSI